MLVEKGSLVGSRVEGTGLFRTGSLVAFRAFNGLGKVPYRD